MKIKTSERKHEFIIIHANDIKQAKEFFYKMFIEEYWMFQIIAIKLMSEIIDIKEFYRLKRSEKTKN
jgi:hypothetical protein